jgi:hypothetical protein
MPVDLNRQPVTPSSHASIFDLSPSLNSSDLSPLLDPRSDLSPLLDPGVGSLTVWSCIRAAQFKRAISKGPTRI